jgi:DNA polymerase III gamma/tau subunit
LELDDVRGALTDKFLSNEGAEDKSGDKTEVDETTVDVAARYGGGSLGRSIHMLKSGLLASRRDLAERIFDADPSRIAPTLELAEELGRNNDQLADQLDVLKLFLRDVMVASVPEREATLNNPDLAETIARYARQMGTSGAAQRIELIQEAQTDIERNVNGQIVLESLLPDLKIAAPNSSAG